MVSVFLHPILPFDWSNSYLYIWQSKGKLSAIKTIYYDQIRACCSIDTGRKKTKMLAYWVSGGDGGRDWGRRVSGAWMQVQIQSLHEPGICPASIETEVAKIREDEDDIGAYFVPITTGAISSGMNLGPARNCNNTLTVLTIIHSKKSVSAIYIVYISTWFCTHKQTGPLLTKH